jgi:cytochrome oxidase Cu insertion factor (SCO1/SenC/PrrC family)
VKLAFLQSVQSFFTTRVVVRGLIALTLLAAGGFVYMELMKKGFIRYNKWDRRVRGQLKVGDTAPDVSVVRYEGGDVRLSSLWEGKPVLLVFGSCT